MKEMFKSIVKWFGDERSSVLTEKSLIVAVCVIGGIALGAIALPRIKTYAETIFTQFEGATTEDGFSS